jgi:hypothetical protein
MKYALGSLFVVAGALAGPTAAQQPLDATCSASATQATGYIHPERTPDRMAAGLEERLVAQRREQRQVPCKTTAMTMLPMR